MERKRLFGVGVDGSPEQGDLPADVTWISTGSTGGTFVFGVKERSEDDAERALHYALRFLDSRQRTAVKYVTVEIEGSRTSINWAGEIAPELKRLEPGDIFVAPDLASIYERLFVFEKDEDKQGVLYLLRGDRRRPKRTRGLSVRFGRMIGRDGELSRLHELVQQSREDQGQIVALTGAAGIGKTRLKMALLEHLENEGIEAHEGVYQFRKRETYQGFRQIVAALLAKRGTKLDVLGLTIAELDYLELLTKQEGIPESLKGLSDEDLKKGLFFAVRKLIHHAAKNPLVLLFEDLHWADTGSRELLEYLMEEMERTKLLLVLIHRPEVKGGWTKRLNYTAIEIRPFDQPELKQFVKDVSSVDRVPQSVVSMMESVSLGNPLFVEEMLRHLLDSKALEIQTLDNEEKLLGGKSPKLSEMPSTLHSLIASRFDRLPEKAKETLRWAAVIGMTFNFEEYVDLFREELGADPGQEIEQLSDHKYLFEKSVFPVHEYQFTHDLIHAVVLENIPSRDAAVFHRKVGMFLENRNPAPSFDMLALISDHYLQGDDSKQAIVTAVRAGEEALALFRLKQADHLLSEALRKWKQDRIEGVSPHSIYRPLTRVLTQTADLRTAADTIEEWGKHDVMSDARVRADYATQLMRIRAMENRHEDANVASELALAAFRELKDTSEAKYRLIGERLISLRRTGRLKDALIELKNAVAEMGERYPEVRALLLGGLAVVSTRVGHKEDALAYVEQAIQLFPKNASIVSQISFSLLLGSAYEYLQMHVETKRIYDEVISNTKEMGMRHSYIELLMWRAANANEWGEYNLSFKDLEEVGASARQMKSVVLAEWSSLCVVDNLLDLGVIPEAVERWHAFKKEFPKPNDSGQEARRLNIDAALAEHQGDYQTALSYRKRGVVIYDKLGDLVTVGRIQFRILRYEVLMGARSVEEAVGEFNRMVTATDQIHVSHWQYARHEAAYFLAAQGGHPEPGPDLAYDPLSECLCAYYRQYLAVAKIQWLDAAMNYNAADELRTRYREMREKMKEKIPAKYHVAFVNHPSYRVPERGRC